MILYEDCTGGQNDIIPMPNLMFTINMGLVSRILTGGHLGNPSANPRILADFFGPPCFSLEYG